MSLYDFLGPALGICNAAALLLVGVFLVRGPLRKFWVVFAYVCWELLATASLTIADVLIQGTAAVTIATRTPAQMWYGRFFWTNDVIVDLLRFVLVIVLIYRASAEQTRRALAPVLTGLVVAMIGLPFVLFHPTFHPVPRTPWFNSTSELLNFGAAIMNLILWGTLLASRKRDPQILMVSLGLGVVVTGAAIGYGLRFLIPADASVTIPNIFVNITQLIGWSIWVRAFRPARKNRGVANPAVPAR